MYKFMSIAYITIIMGFMVVYITAFVLNLIRAKKPFEVKVLDSETNFKTWKDNMYKKKSISFIANRAVLDSSVIYLNYSNGRTSKVWVYNLQDIESDL